MADFPDRRRRNRPDKIIGGLGRRVDGPLPTAWQGRAVTEAGSGTEPRVIDADRDVALRPKLHGRVRAFQTYTRPLRRSEAVGNFRAGCVNRGPTG